MSNNGQFAGFPRQSMKFLSDLAANNDRDWFEAHRADYENYLLAPAVAFVEAVGAALQAVVPGINYDTRTNGSGSMMRIYRDTRFSKDKRPYKDWLGFRFWEGSGKASGNPGFFFGLTANDAGLHVGMHGFDKPLLAAYREAVVDDKRGTALEKALDEVRAAGDYEIRGEHYKRVPRGFDADHPRADLLRHNALYTSAPSFPPKLVTSPGLVDAIVGHARALAPLHRWLVALKKGVG